MRIDNLPAVFMFEGNEERDAVLRIGKEDGCMVYSFTVRTPRLIRMGCPDDNSVQLFLSGRWERFTATGASTLPDADVSVEILENNNKRSRYRIRIVLPGDMPDEIRARAETLEID